MSAWNQELANVLVAGGDSRIAPDPQTGRNKYACLATPDTGLTELGSSTASSISLRGWQAAETAWLACKEQLKTTAEAELYQQQMTLLRQRLHRLTGGAAGDGSDIVFAASGTDIHLLIAQLLQPDLTLMIANEETGSGLSAALKGRHFSKDSTCIGGTPQGDCVSSWQGELKTFEARNGNGEPVDSTTLMPHVLDAAEQAAKAGKTVLCILTDVSKTGLIFPDANGLLNLKQRFPDKVWILVDGCQFRLAPSTIQAYLSQGCLLALTGSKFLAGPTFSGALLIPSSLSKTLAASTLSASVSAYSVAGDWPENYVARQTLPRAANFGLLLRWVAALAELEALSVLKQDDIASFMSAFGHVVRQRLQTDPHFAPLPVPALQRSLHPAPCWDQLQSIFPFLLFRVDSNGKQQPLTRPQTAAMYQALQAADASERFQLGQPVLCGSIGDTPVSALRLCVSAAMLSDALSQPTGQAKWIAAIHAALDKLAKQIDQLAT